MYGKRIAMLLLISIAALTILCKISSFYFIRITTGQWYGPKVIAVFDEGRLIFGYRPIFPPSSFREPSNNPPQRPTCIWPPMIDCTPRKLPPGLLSCLFALPSFNLEMMDHNFYYNPISLTLPYSFIVLCIFCILFAKLKLCRLWPQQVAEPDREHVAQGGE